MTGQLPWATASCGVILPARSAMFSTVDVNKLHCCTVYVQQQSLQCVPVMATTSSNDAAATTMEGIPFLTPYPAV